MQFLPESMTRTSARMTGSRTRATTDPAGQMARGKSTSPSHCRTHRLPFHRSIIDVSVPPAPFVPTAQREHMPGVDTPLRDEMPCGLSLRERTQPASDLVRIRGRYASPLRDCPTVHKRP